MARSLALRASPVSGIQKTNLALVKGNIDFALSNLKPQLKIKDSGAFYLSGDVKWPKMAVSVFSCDD